FAPEPGASTIRTGQVAPVAAQEHADVYLVLLPLEPAKEAADSLVVVGALDGEADLFVREIAPRYIEPNLALARGALQLGELRTIVRLAPRLDRALLDRFRAVRHDQVHVQFDDVAKAVADRTRTEGVVEREEPRLRILV